MNSMIKYEDDDIIVIHKPAGIATETAKLGQADVVSELKNYLYSKKKGQEPYLGMVHRLDQPVEGLLVFGKTPQSTRFLTDSLQDKRLSKSYHALVQIGENNNVPGGGTLVDYLQKDKKTNLSKVVQKSVADSKRAELIWKLENVYQTENGRYGLVEVELVTGRHHQIRVQMSHAGMPLLGDSKYGNAESARISGFLGLKNTALLADRLEFIHPKTKEKLTFYIDYPQSWGLNVDKNC